MWDACDVLWHLVKTSHELLTLHVVDVHVVLIISVEVVIIITEYILGLLVLWDLFSKTERIIIDLCGCSFRAGTPRSRSPFSARASCCWS